MAFIQWDDSLSVNVVEIDNQHKKLVEMINDLHDAMKQGQSKLILSRIINGLIGYTVTHFKTEEKYFEQFGYPAELSHKKEHATFTQKVADFKDEYDAGKTGLSLDIMDFLSSWLRSHIKGSDKRYAPFFHEKGLR